MFTHLDGVNNLSMNTAVLSISRWLAELNESLCLDWFTVARVWRHTLPYGVLRWSNAKLCTICNAVEKVLILDYVLLESMVTISHHQGQNNQVGWCWFSVDVMVLGESIDLQLLMKHCNMHVCFKRILYPQTLNVCWDKKINPFDEPVMNSLQYQYFSWCKCDGQLPYWHMWLNP